MWIATHAILVDEAFSRVVRLVRVDVVRRDAPLLVRGAGEGDGGAVLLDYVAGGEDVGVGGLEVSVHLDVPAGAEVESGGLGEGGVGADTERHDDEVGGDGRAVVERGDVVGPRGDGAPGADVHAGLGEGIGGPGGHLGVEHRGEDVRGLLHEGRPQAAPRQVLGRLHADGAAADDERGLRPPRGGDETVHVRERIEREDALIGKPGDGDADGARAGGEEQAVVGQCLRRPIGVAHGNGLGCAVDGRGLAVGAHLHVEALAEALGGHHQQVVPLRDDPAEVIRQAAIRIGDGRALLHHHNLGELVQPPQPRRRARPRGHPADDDDPHRASSLSFSMVVPSDETMSTREQARIMAV